MTPRSPNRQFKDAIYEQFARIGKAISSPRRLELLDLLCQGARTVEKLAGETGLSVANTSQHLQVLRAARLVDAERQGQYAVYRMAGPEACEFFQGLLHVGEKRLSEIERLVREFLNGRDGMEPVDRQGLLARVHNGEVTVLDVRPVEEYRAGHLPGAVSVPLEELESRLADLPRDREVVAYCRGPYCVLAVEAVERLQARGFRAVRLDEGVQQWRARGLALAMGDSA